MQVKAACRHATLPPLTQSTYFNVVSLIRLLGPSKLQQVLAGFLPLLIPLRQPLFPSRGCWIRINLLRHVRVELPLALISASLLNHLLIL